MSKTAPAQDRLAPHAFDAERGVLGAALLDPTQCVTEVVHQPVEMFYDLRHQVILSAMAGLAATGTPLDTITLTNELKRIGKLEAVGGALYIEQLADACPSTANLPYWLGFLRDKRIERRILAFGARVPNLVYEWDGEVSDLLAKIEKEALAIRDDDNGSEFDMRAEVGALIDHVEAVVDGKVEPGLTTGFRDLDRSLQGLKPQQLLLLAARPSVGKTALALAISDHLLRKGTAVGYISLEMSTRELLMRLALSRSSLSSNAVAPNSLTQAELGRLGIEMTNLASLPLYIADRGGLTLGTISAISRRWKQRHGIKLLVVDHLGLIAGTRNASLYEKTTATSNGLKTLAKELGIPVLALCQLNRASENEERMPRLADLRDSGALEQDADVVLLLHRGEANGPVDKMTLGIGKHRNGPCGKVDLQFRREFARFETPSLGA